LNIHSTLTFSLTPSASVALCDRRSSKHSTEKQ